MNIELVPNSTEIIEISTEYHTVLKVDNEEIKVTFIELLLDINDSENSYSHITVDVEEYPDNMSIIRAVEFKQEIEDFVRDNSEILVNDIKKLD